MASKLLIILCTVGLSVVVLFADLRSFAMQKNVYVTVSAGALHRRETIVAFRLPEQFKAQFYGLRDSAGRTIPLQIDSKRQASFVLPELKAGTTISYQLMEAKAPGPQRVELVRKGKKLAISTSNRRVLDFQTEGEIPSEDIKPIFLRGGYIHPVYAPSGRIVTDDYPSDHYHHHGIWAAWTNTLFEDRKPDFWNMGDGTGKVEFVAVDDTWSGPVNAGFTSRQRYVDLSGKSPKTALNETWEVRVYNVGNGRTTYSMFDLVLTQECATNSPLVLPEYRYGGVGFRGHKDWKDKTKVSFLTSEGKDRSNGHATRARWCHIGGVVEGQPVGIAILDHPGNFRAPQSMRIHPDDPFFNYAPVQLGQFEIVPGFRYVARYRYIVSDGPPDKAEIDRLWNDYANPPEVVVKW